MAKILLVEDDTDLQVVYSTRFVAEGYQVVTASDGEEALATAVRERPDLIVLDVMMPKISGFDVLDILRSTPETKQVKVIMMTALSQDSDRQRGEALGVNRYLVKSQVTLEDVINAVKEELGNAAVTSPAAPTPAPAATESAPQAAPTSTTPEPTPTPAQTEPPAATSDQVPPAA